MTATALATLERHDLRDLSPRGQYRSVRRQGSDDRQYLTVHMAGEHYGIDILKVQEVWRSFARASDATSKTRPSIGRTAKSAASLSRACWPS
jgi:hypothetical protein